MFRHAILKSALIIVNIIFMFTGLALLGIGVFAATSPTLRSTLDNMIVFATGLAVLGGSVFIVALAGAWGARKNTKKLLFLYWTVIYTLFAVQVIAGCIVLSLVNGGLYRNCLKAAQIQGTNSTSCDSFNGNEFVKLGMQLAWLKFWEHSLQGNGTFASITSVAINFQLQGNCCGFGPPGNCTRDSRRMPAYVTTLSPRLGQFQRQYCFQGGAVSDRWPTPGTNLYCHLGLNTSGVGGRSFRWMADPVGPADAKNPYQGICNDFDYIMQINTGADKLLYKKVVLQQTRYHPWSYYEMPLGGCDKELDASGQTRVSIPKGTRLPAYSSINVVGPNVPVGRAGPVKGCAAQIQNYFITYLDPIRIGLIAMISVEAVALFATTVLLVTKKDLFERGRLK